MPMILTMLGLCQPGGVSERGEGRERRARGGTLTALSKDASAMTREMTSSVRSVVKISFTAQGSFL
jgi:hypothetical protein